MDQLDRELIVWVCLGIRHSGSLEDGQLDEDGVGGWGVKVCDGQ